MTTTDTEVTQADRKAAIELATIIFGNDHSFTKKLRSTDRHFMLDAFARHRTLTPAQAADDEAMHFDWSGSTDAEIIVEVSRLEPLVSPHRNACLIQEMRRRFEAAQAAGPVLLEALKALRDNIGAASLTRNKHGQMIRAMADAAITQAEGPQANG